MSNLCEEQTYNTGEIILEENSATDELYVITQGEVEILVNPSLVSDQPNIQREPVTIATLPLRLRSIFPPPCFILNEH